MKCVMNGVLTTLWHLKVLMLFHERVLCFIPQILIREKHPKMSPNKTLFQSLTVECSRLNLLCELCATIPQKKQVQQIVNERKQKGISVQNYLQAADVLALAAVWKCCQFTSTLISFGSLGTFGAIKQKKTEIYLRTVNRLLCWLTNSYHYYYTLVVLKLGL